MRSSISKIAILALALLAPGQAARARDATGSAAPQIFKAVTAEEAKNPNISKPVEPGVDCYRNVSLQEQGTINDKAKIAHIGKPCLPQTDAFKRAAEASSYLAFYQQNFSDYGYQMRDPKKRKEIETALRECLSNDPKCTGVNGAQKKSDIMKALVQYNFGKDLKASMIENQTRAERMKSVAMPAQAWRDLGDKVQPIKLLSWKGSLKSRSVRENSFRLDPAKVEVFEPNKLTAEERNRLGAEFNNSFNSFVNEYTSTTGQNGPKSRWHYVTVKNSAVPGQQVSVSALDFKNEDTRQGKSRIDMNRLDRDIKSQDGNVVREIVASFKEQYKDVIATPTGTQKQINVAKNTVTQVSVDTMKLAYEDAGFGLPKAELAKIGDAGGPATPKDVAAAVVITINKAINDSEIKMAKENAANRGERVPSSASPGKSNITPSVTVDVQAFDKFLNQIWPSNL